MHYLDLFSGISAPTVAWKPMGWQAVAYAEIEKFPSTVLAHHYPTVPNVGDVTKVNWDEWKGKADLVIAGSPCQSFSAAGKRRGLDDERGNLALEAIRIASRVNARWFILENAPGILSANQGYAFARILHEMEQCGYGFAYRVLDARNWGVPQQRKRVYLVGYSGDWQTPARVLLEPRSHKAFDRRNTKSTYRPIENFALIAGNLIGRKYNRKRANRISNTGYCPTLTRFDRHAIAWNGIARYLAPNECLSLQGFSSSYLDKLGTDEQQYKAIGNSMAVPVIRWLGKRIEEVDALST